MDPNDFSTYEQELRRGTVVLAALVALRTPGYGYGLLEELAAAGFDADANTLYPLLRRLEKHGFLTSEWDTGESRPRKFYRTSEAGNRLAAHLIAHWNEIDGAMRRLTEGDAS